MFCRRLQQEESSQALENEFYFAGLPSPPAFGTKKSVLAASISSQRMFMYVGLGLGLQREAEVSPFSFCSLGVFVAWDCEGTRVFFSLFQHPQTKQFYFLSIFLLSLNFYFPFEHFLSY